MHDVPSLNKYSAKFKDSALEHEYRKTFLKGDIKSSIIYLAFIACILLYSLFKKAVIDDNSGSFSYILLRVGTVVFLASSIMICLKLKNYKATDKILFFITIICSITFFAVHYMTPERNLVRTIVYLIILMSYYLIIPNRLMLQTISAVFFSTLILIATHTCKFEISETKGFIAAVYISLLSGNILGFYYSRLLHLSRRTQYFALSNQKILNKKLEQANTDIKTLEEIIPICCSCKKIRNDKGYWEQVERYFMRHTDSQFSHGICPDCVKKLYPEYQEDE